ncbi:MAG: hypothetical protein AB8B63_17845 [Granulosicoccus sp.]
MKFFFGEYQQTTERVPVAWLGPTVMNNTQDDIQQTLQQLEMAVSSACRQEVGSDRVVIAASSDFHAVLPLNNPDGPQPLNASNQLASNSV